jgi:hypothetical protein
VTLALVLLLPRSSQAFINTTTSYLEAKRGGPRTGSLAKGAGGERVGPGHDTVLQRMKGWKMRNKYNKIDGWDGDA